MKTFDELYSEYQKSIEIQKGVIGRYRLAIMKANKKSNMGEVERLNRILCVLYEEKSELEERTAEMRNYLLKIKAIPHN